MSRYKTYELETQEEGKQKTTIRLRKWSVSKFLHLLSEVGEVAKALGEHFKLDKNLNVPQAAELIVMLGDTAAPKVNKLIRESVDKPKLTEEEIGEWELEDYVGVVAAILEMNLTTGLAKNFGRLREAVKIAPKLPTNNRQEKAAATP